MNCMGLHVRSYSLADLLLFPIPLFLWQELARVCVIVVIENIFVLE